MFNIDKKKFGAFVAALRKEKGITQKELSEQLCISDKAVSKWETGVSLPDTVLLIPLANLLDVSVTELLMCERLPNDDVLKPDKVEDIVKTAITYADESPERAYHVKSKWIVFYGFSPFDLLYRYISELYNGAALHGNLGNACASKCGIRRVLLLLRPH